MVQSRESGHKPARTEACAGRLRGANGCMGPALQSLCESVPMQELVLASHCDGAGLLQRDKSVSRQCIGVKAAKAWCQQMWHMQACNAHALVED